MSEIVKAHVPCEFCGSSDGATIYTDHKFCFVCEKHTWLDDTSEYERGRSMSSMHLDIIPDSEMEIKALRAKGITSETCQKYDYFVTKDDYGHPLQVANYKKDRQTVYQKTRDKNKNFTVRGK